MVLILPPAHINAVVGINNYIFNTFNMINLTNLYVLSLQQIHCILSNILNILIEIAFYTITEEQKQMHLMHLQNKYR